jgi:prephenate dehydrogenase
VTESAPIRLAILGLGLMGASLAKALKASGASYHITGWTRDVASRAEARMLPFFDAVTDTEADAVMHADLVVLGVPVVRIPELTARIAPHVRPGSVITDVGSTKQWLTEQMPVALVGSGAAYVPSHPMCGSEKTGLRAARSDLYQGATVVVCAETSASNRAVEVVRALWQAAGANVVEMTATLHDKIVAQTSHLPHMTAAVLMATVARDGVTEDLRLLAAGGLRDTSRVAAGSADVWIDILATNRDHILRELHHLREVLDTTCTALETSDYDTLRALLTQAAKDRDTLFPG